MNSLTTELIKIFDININSDYCANTAILYKESLDKYKFIFHLVDDNNHYVPCPDSTMVSLTVSDESFSKNIQLYNPNMGCIKIEICSEMFNSVATEHGEFNSSLLVSVIGLSNLPNKVFKIPVTVIPGYEPEDDLSRKSKVEDNYATGGNHAESRSPKFSNLIHYLF